jgi:Domain of unknown function (DUF3303)
MRTDDPATLDQWIECWNDVADFEVYSVMTSQEAAEKVSGIHGK